MKLNLRAIDLNLLTIFNAIMTEGQLSRAAEQLHMTQPAVSQALARLRATFDDELFVRTRKGMVPTLKARALASPIRDALIQIQEALEANQDFDPRTAERTFRIAFRQYGEISLLPSLLQQVNREAEAITIESVGDDGNGLEQVREYELDFCFDVAVPEDDRLDSCLCGTEEWVVIARKQHPRLRKSITAQQYFQEKHIILALTGEKKEMVQKTFSVFKSQRRILAEAQQFIAIPSLVMQSDAIATVPRKMTEFVLYRDQLTIMEMPLKLPATPFYLVWHRAMNKDQGHQWLRQMILACC